MGDLNESALFWDRGRPARRGARDARGPRAALFWDRGRLARRGARDARGPRAAFCLLALAFATAPALSQDSDAARPAYWGSPSVDGGKCCQTLGEVRANIDRLDGEILAAMAERGKYVAEAGRFKKDPAAVSAPGRVEAIIARVRKTAAEDGLSPDVAEKSYRAMIAAFEDYERAEWLKRHPAEP